LPYNAYNESGSLRQTDSDRPGAADDAGSCRRAARAVWRDGRPEGLLMTIPLEIMLRGNDRVFTETIMQPGDPASWAEQDVAALLKNILLAIDRVQFPDKQEEPEVSLRGLSWIVHPSGSGVVIAIEISIASAVAGPLNLSEARLDSLITRALKAASPTPTVVH
jgi:hypothetical protein